MQGSGVPVLACVSRWRLKQQCEASRSGRSTAMRKPAQAMLLPGGGQYIMSAWLRVAGVSWSCQRARGSACHAGVLGSRGDTAHMHGSMRFK